MYTQHSSNKKFSKMSQIYKSFIFLATLVAIASAADEPLRPWLKNRRLATRAQSSSPPQAPAAPVSAPASTGTPSVVEVPLAKSIAVSPTITIPSTPPQTTNRSTRTADIFEKDYNIIVTNTCEREFMKINIEVSKPFYGLIHTQNQRDKSVCSVMGNGEQRYSLEISHILNSADPNYCGVIRARRDSVDDKDVLSVVIAVRVHRVIQLPDDKFFLLNCTNRCRKPDCSLPSARLTDLSPSDAEDIATTNNNNNNGEREAETAARDRNPGLNDDCTIWKFPWLITLLWCLAILLLAMIISHCIMCSSMVCKCVKTEVEEREPSVYEGATDYEDDDQHDRNTSHKKKSPFVIDYDNKNIYKTSNNYAPYTLEENQTRRKYRGSR